MQEGVPFEDRVDNHQAKHYLFRLEARDAAAVTFELVTHHGDPDIYVSRVNKYPTAADNEAHSSKSTWFTDSVTFTSAHGALDTTYYITVEGFTYSTYTLVAKVQHDADDKSVIVMKEGVPVEGTLKADETLLYKFKPNMSGEWISDILVVATNLVG